MTFERFFKKSPRDIASNSKCHNYLLYKTDRSVIRIPYMVKANERIAVPNKRIEGPNKRIQVPKGIQTDLTSEYRYLKYEIPIGPIFAMQNTFKYNKKLFAWQRNPSW